MTIRILEGHVLEVLRGLAAESVHSVVTSPPYYGLRDYGIEPQVWDCPERRRRGGEADCEHDFETEIIEREIGTGLGMAALGERYRGGGHKAGAVPKIRAERGVCVRCGAWRGSLGLEPTLDCGVPKMRVRRDLTLNQQGRLTDYVRRGNFQPCHQNSQKASESAASLPAIVLTTSLIKRGGEHTPGPITQDGGDETQPSKSRETTAGASSSAGKFLKPMAANASVAEKVTIDSSPSTISTGTAQIIDETARTAPECTLTHGCALEDGPKDSKSSASTAISGGPQTAESVLTKIEIYRHEVPPNLADCFETATCGACYLCHMTEICREVRRVLRRDGTFWLNIGDSYSGVPTARGLPFMRHTEQKSGLWAGTAKAKRDLGNGGSFKDTTGLKPKDLLLIPARLAIRLQEDGWWVRSEIVWAKRAPMPESVNDRPTCAHEKIFLLTKSARYFYDSIAVQEPGEMKPQNRFTDGKGSKADGYAAHRQPTGMTEAATRNCRNVWTLPPFHYPDAHFATFTPELPRRCILAGTSAKGVCPKCGAPWAKVMRETKSWRDGAETRPQAYGPGSGNRRARPSNGGMSRSETETLGWRPSCGCEAGDPIPATCLDPFAGSGTTLLVADRLGRDCIGIELSPKYAAMARHRIEDDAGMFADLAAE